MDFERNQDFSPINVPEFYAIDSLGVLASTAAADNLSGSAASTIMVTSSLNCPPQNPATSLSTRLANAEAVSSRDIRSIDSILLSPYSSPLAFAASVMPSVNRDGTNQRALYDQPGKYALFPTFSSDGRKIAFELQEPGDGGMLDGIAIMNADGSQVVRLTLNNDSNCTNGLDIMPAFTSDSQQVIFTRECYPLDGGVSSALYAVSVNGTTAPNSIWGSPGAGYLALQARPFTDGAVLFSSNAAAPGTNAFDIWSIENDGSIPTRITNNTLYDGFSLRWMSGRNIVVPANPAPHRRHDK